MFKFSQPFNIATKGFCIVLLCIMAWQQWITFSNHEKEFLKPIHFIKENYGNDFITQYGNRYEDVKKIFTKPVHLTYIGEANEDYNTGVMHYYLTQYYLAPNIILKDTTPRDTILYNLYSSIHINQETNFYLKNGWHLVKDFNNGLIVLAK